MTTSYKETRSRIISVFVILLLVVRSSTVQAQTDSLHAIKLTHTSFASLQASKSKSFYLPYSSNTYNLAQPSQYQNETYFRQLYSPSKETLKSVLFDLIGSGVLTYFGDQTNRNYISPPKNN